jgi:nucleoside-diphosphate kinase
MDRTLIVLKPDAVQRQLLGRIIDRFERKGLQIVAMKMLQVSPELAQKMYEMHRGQHFYEALLVFITRSPVVAVVLAGEDVTATVRRMLGPTDGRKAPAGTLRGDFGMSTRCNLVHASDSAASADREIPLFFQPEELVEYRLDDATWIYGRQEPAN